jgi:hypothetical protein
MNKSAILLLNTSTEQFTQFNDLLLSIQPTQETFILGDFNIDLLKNDAQHPAPT